MTSLERTTDFSVLVIHVCGTRKKKNYSSRLFGENIIIFTKTKIQQCYDYSVEQVALFEVGKCAELSSYPVPARCVCLQTTWRRAVALSGRDTSRTLLIRVAATWDNCIPFSQSEMCFSLMDKQSINQVF